VIRSTTALALGLLLAALPLSMSNQDDGLLSGVTALAAKGGNNKSNAGGNGKGNGTVNGDTAVSAAASKPGKSKDKSQLAKSDPLHPSNLGRLNAFFSASSTSLKNAGDNSAIGLISQVYAGQLSAYLGALSAATTDTTLDPLATAELEAAASTLAALANKPLTAEIIAAIHERLAAENSANPALAGLASPSPELLALNDPAAVATAAANAALVTSVLAASSSADNLLTNNGLGQIY
jgi:hypothetical protein